MESKFSPRLNLLVFLFLELIHRSIYYFIFLSRGYSVTIMDNLIQEIVWLQDKGWLRGFVFGLVHTIIPLIGFYSGWSINRMLKLISNGFIAGIIGVVVAHVIADYIAAILDPNLRTAAVGIVLGGLVPLIIIPFLDKYIVKSKHHIEIGDHEDLKKDLKAKHK